MKKCYIVEDLLALYHDDLLQKESKEWLEEHVSHCKRCKNLMKISKEPIIKEVIEPEIDYEKMMKKNNFKISLYQMLFLGISFFLAIRSTILMEDFSFVLYYTILGFVSYLFYKRYVTVMLISFLPIFFYQLGSFLIEIKDIIQDSHTSLGILLRDILFGSFIFGGIPLLFAIIGATIGLFTLKLFEGGDAND